MHQEQLDITLEIAGIFHKLGIRYLLGGSMASSFHGIHRSTNDSDFVAEFSAENIKPFCEMLGQDYYVSREAIEEALRLSRSFNAIHMQTALKIDVFVMKPDEFSESQMSRRVSAKIDTGSSEGTLFIASPEDTILSKLDWYQLGGGVSERQLNDILGVIKTQGIANLDTGYIRLWAEKLGVLSIFEKVLKDAEI